MLHFFRRYQRFFFLIVTVVIIISFSFFGTYSTLESPSMNDRTAFTSVDGQTIKHSELESMALFLGSDNNDKVAFGGIWGPNFLNEGVITKDFLQTGLAAILVEGYQGDLEQELSQRLTREKRSSFYHHPNAPFITAEAVWGYFAPGMREQVERLRQSSNATTNEAFNARVDLFLAEKSFPPQLLKQVIKYQEKQYGWLKPDPYLDGADLSLFGYHTMEDWFGPRFVRLVSQFIINAAKIAEKKGYVVTRDEAMADLTRQAQLSFQQQQNNPALGVTDANQYLRTQLRRMGLDEGRATKIWQQVLLFRRLFYGVGDAVFVDPLPFQLFNQYALETAQGTLYTLPESLRLPDYRSLQRFEIYLGAVAKPREKNTLALPSQFLSVDEVKKSTPELMQKRYVLEIARADSKPLQGRVSLKEMWKWQTEDANWEHLKQEFPELGVSKATNSQERFAALEKLNDTTRSRVDAEARSAIIATHPEWLTEALSNAEVTKGEVGIRLKGGRQIVTGLEKPEELIALLDVAPLPSDISASPAAKQAQQKLDHYTVDNQTFYRIRVLDRAKDLEVVTYGQAASDGTLDKLLTAALEPQYMQLRERNPEQYRKADGTWKSLTEVQDAVADVYFKDLVTALEQGYKQNVAQKDAQAAPSRNDIAAHRLFAFVRTVQEKLQKDPSLAAEWLAQAAAETKPGTLSPATETKDQFKLVSKDYALARSDDRPEQDKTVLLALAPKQWTPTQQRSNGDIWFFQLAKKQVGDTQSVTAKQLAAARSLLAVDAQHLLMYQVLEEIKARNAISFGSPERDSKDNTTKSVD